MSFIQVHFRCHSRPIGDSLREGRICLAFHRSLGNRLSLVSHVCEQVHLENTCIIIKTNFYRFYLVCLDKILHVSALLNLLKYNLLNTKPLPKSSFYVIVILPCSYTRLTSITTRQCQRFEYILAKALLDDITDNSTCLRYQSSYLPPRKS